MTSPLRFEVADLVTEVELMRELSGKFLVADASDILIGIKDQFDGLRYSNQNTTIQVNTARPIRTKPCNGGYERGNGGTYKDLFGELLFKWELRPLGVASSKLAARRQVEVAGIASSVARLKIERQGVTALIASWRMEFGDSNSPGAFFHVQIPDTLPGSDGEREPAPQQMWPRWLPVPRLPIPAMTPMLALEFILAEIFQEDWPQHLASGGYAADRWRTFQLRRYVAYFEWQKKNVEVSGKGSPILSMKDAKPAAEFFLSC